MQHGCIGLTLRLSRRGPSSAGLPAARWLPRLTSASEGAMCSRRDAVQLLSRVPGNGQRGSSSAKLARLWFSIFESCGCSLSRGAARRIVACFPGVVRAVTCARPAAERDACVVTDSEARPKRIRPRQAKSAMPARQAVTAAKLKTVQAQRTPNRPRAHAGC
jgi:hypothetical protein